MLLDALVSVNLPFGLNMSSGVHEDAVIGVEH